MGTHMYVYACARDDEFTCAVGIQRDSGAAQLGLFVTREDAMLFANAKRERDAIPVIVLPSTAELNA